MLAAFEADPGGAVELADDHPLAAVDDEGAAGGHQGDVAHAEGLLVDVLLAVALHLEGDEEFALVGAAGLQEFGEVVLPFLDLIFDELNAEGAGIGLLHGFLGLGLGLSLPLGGLLFRGGDPEPGREGLHQHGLEAGLRALLGGHVHLEEIRVGFGLQADEVRNGEDFLQTAEVDALAFHLAPSVTTGGWCGEAAIPAQETENRRRQPGRPNHETKKRGKERGTGEVARRPRAGASWHGKGGGNTRPPQKKMRRGAHDARVRRHRVHPRPKTASPLWGESPFPKGRKEVRGHGTPTRRPPPRDGFPYHPGRSI